MRDEQEQERGGQCGCSVDTHVTAATSSIARSNLSGRTGPSCIGMWMRETACRSHVVSADSLRLGHCLLPRSSSTMLPLVIAKLIHHHAAPPSLDDV